MKASPAASLSLAFLACLAPAHAGTLEARDLVAPSDDLANSWEYLGCYLYVSAHTDPIVGVRSTRASQEQQADQPIAMLDARSTRPTRQMMR